MPVIACNAVSVIFLRFCGIRLLGSLSRSKPMPQKKVYVAICHDQCISRSYAVWIYSIVLLTAGLWTKEFLYLKTWRSEWGGDFRFSKILERTSYVFQLWVQTDCCLDYFSSEFCPLFEVIFNLLNSSLAPFFYCIALNLPNSLQQDKWQKKRHCKKAEYWYFFFSALLARSAFWKKSRRKRTSYYCNPEDIRLCCQ